MSLEPIEQLREFLKKSKSVLILLPQDPDGDAIGAGWGLYFFLQKMLVKTTLAFADPYKKKERFSFLPSPQNIAGSIAGSRDFVLIFNTLHNKIMNVRTEQKEKELSVYITPEHGSIDPRDFSFVPAQFKFDLIIALGCSDKESTGTIYEEDPDIFYEVPIVNIDHHSDNDNFAQINMVSVTASATSEMLVEIFERLQPEYFDETIAQCLLAGIISATESFQKKNTTPKALQVAAKLMDKGADQQNIIRWMYKTQPLNILKLWGRVMARLKWDDQLKLAWSLITVDDFVQSRSGVSDIPHVLEKVKDNYSAGKIFLVLFNETQSVIRGMAKLIQPEMSHKFAAILPHWKEESSEGIFSFSIDETNLLDAESAIIEKIKAGLK